MDGTAPPPPPRGRPSDGKTAARFVLTAYVSRAYDVIDAETEDVPPSPTLPDHLDPALPPRPPSCAEVNGVRSHSRPFRAGLPQGSVLAPTLFSCSGRRKVVGGGPVVGGPGGSAGRVPDTSDDMATLCSGGHRQGGPSPRDRAQQAADTITRWARDWKMRLPGSRTQALVLSQRYQDTRDFHIGVDGAWDNTVRTSFAS